MSKIKFGPAGIGPVKEVESTFQKYKTLGISSAEIPFTYSVYIKTKEQAEQVGKSAEKFNINLSIHAPYWINLNSKENEKIQASKKRILKSCEIAHHISKTQNQKTKVVFHCGFYTGMEKEEVYQNIKNQILDLKQQIKKNNWNVELCPEVMGKKNVFGSIEEISRLTKETNCSFCIDFAHILARYGVYEWDLIKKSFPQKTWHCHFSGIEYSEKSGEKKHKATPEEEWKKLLNFLKNLDKEITIINESDNPVKDSIQGLKLWRELN